MQIPPGVEIVCTEHVSEHLQRVRMRAGLNHWSIIVKSYAGVSSSSAGGSA